jgi:hypothetical protein
MSWDAIGAISDFVAAGAVIVTLAYLSVQIRDSQKTVKSHATFISVDLASKWRSALTQDTQMAEIVAKANKSEQLTDAEQIRLTTFAEELFIINAVSFAVSDQSGALHKKSGEVEYVWSNLVRNPSLIREWSNSSEIVELVSIEFHRLLSERIQNFKRPTNGS